MRASDLLGAGSAMGRPDVASFCVPAPRSGEAVLSNNLHVSCFQWLPIFWSVDHCRAVDVAKIWSQPHSVMHLDGSWIGT